MLIIKPYIHTTNYQLNVAQKVTVLSRKHTWALSIDLKYLKPQKLYVIVIRESWYDILYNDSI